MAEPAEAQVALADELVQERNVEAAVRATPPRAEGDQRELPLEVGVTRPKSQELRPVRRAVTRPVHLGDRLLRRDGAAEMEDGDLRLPVRAPIGRGEALPGDVVAHPVVLPSLDGLGQIAPDLHPEGVGHRRGGANLPAVGRRSRRHPQSLEAGLSGLGVGLAGLDQPAELGDLTDARLPGEHRLGGEGEKKEHGRRGGEPHRCTPFLSKNKGLWLQYSKHEGSYPLNCNRFPQVI